MEPPTDKEAPDKDVRSEALEKEALEKEVLEKEALEKEARQKEARQKARRRAAIRWWLGLVLIVGGVLGVLDNRSWGPKWSQAARWFWPIAIMTFGIAGLIGQRGFSLGLTIIVLTGLALIVPHEPWVWFGWLVAIGLLIALEQYLPERFRPWKSEHQTSGKHLPQQQAPVKEPEE